MVEFRTNNFDLLRIFAASQVLVLHAFYRLDVAEPIWVHPLDMFPGVPIFFIISGILVSASLEKAPSLPLYFRNRFLRIFPGLWVCVAITAIVTAAFGFSTASPSGIVWFVAQLAGLIYTPAFLHQFGVGTYNGNLWTIPVELQFYVVIPIVYWIGSRLKATTAAILIALVAFVALADAVHYIFPNMGYEEEPQAGKLLRYTFVPHFYMFLFGVALRRLRIYERPWIAGRLWIWLPLYVAEQYGVSALGIARVPEVLIVSSLMLGVVALSAAYTLPELAERTLRGNDISYGVYMYHGLVINVLVQLAWPLGNWWVTPVVILVSVLLGYASWRLVESPALRWGKAPRRIPAL